MSNETFSPLRKLLLVLGLVLGTLMLQADGASARDGYCSWVVAVYYDTGETDDCLICDYGDYCIWGCVGGQSGSC